MHICKMKYFISNAIKTDVTAIKLLNNTCLIGIGNYLHIYDNKSTNLLKKVNVFQEQLFGIEVNKNVNKLLLFGANKLKTFSYNEDTLQLIELHSISCNDWILASKFIDDDTHISTVLMHNTVILYNFDMQGIKTVICEERCILYSAFIANDTWKDLLILSGTVFNQVLIWYPAKSTQEFCTVSYRLKGHKGVIFSIDYNSELGLICSTSDDRTTRLWSINGDLLTKTDTQISLKTTLYGHTARVYRCKLLNNYILTAGEDSLVNIWNIDGDFLRKIDTHQGGCVWALDCNEASNVFITGGEDCGVSIFNINLKVTKETLNITKTARKVLIFSNNNLLAVTEDGTLVYYNYNQRKFIEIYQHVDLQSYVLLEKSQCENFVAVAGYHGNIHIYNMTEISYMFSCQIKDKGRIYSLHWLSCKSILTCGENGMLIMWIVRNGLIPIHFFCLPLSKERWTTSACLCGTHNIVIGDRRGNLYLYSFESVDPVQIIKKAHNYLGITQVYFKNDEVTSLGRNSVINKYKFKAKDGLVLTSSDKTPFTWLAALYQGNFSILFAFSGMNLVVWDYKARRVLLEDYCGGGHRSWDVCVNNKELCFCYIKDKNINLIRSNKSSLQPKEVCEGNHIKEINTVKSIKLPNQNYLLISGGEDTTLRLCLFNPKECNQLKNVNVLKSHLSSIRTITIVKINPSNASVNYLIFSAGGRAQIIMWELTFTNNSVTSHCSEKHAYYEPLSRDDSETRIMDLCSMQLNDDLILFAACSDGSIKVYKIDEFKLILIRKFTYKLKCLLKIHYCEINSSKILITMATDGYIVFWNLNNLNDQKVDLKPTNSIKAHKSGINSYSIWHINENSALFLTGGDDNSIHLNYLEFNGDFEVKATYSNESMHCAQITGALIYKNYFITSSIDQKVLLFKWSLLDEELHVEFMDEYNTSVCDAQGLECLDVQDGIQIVVYGRGFEILTVNTNCIEKTVGY